MPVRCAHRLLLAALAFAMHTGGGAPVAWSAPALVIDAHQAATAEGRVVRSATAAGVVAGPLGDVALAVSRLHDSIDGPGLAVGVGVGAGVGSVLTARAFVSRAHWDRAADAWTVSAGPEVQVLGNAFTARVEHTRYDDGRTLRGAAIDLEHPVTPRWTARAEASYARGSDGGLARSFLGGARFRACGPIAILGEAGMAHDPYGVLAGARGGESAAPGLPGILRHDPLAPGSPAAPSPSSALHPTLLLGARCLLP